MSKALDFKKLLNKRNPVIVEIGAADGLDTLEFLKEFPGATIYCFEPDPRGIHFFKNTVKSSQCHLYECAVSDKDGVSEFYMSIGYPPGYGGDKVFVYDNGTKMQKWEGRDEWYLSSSIKKPKERRRSNLWIKFGKKIKVKTVKLDSWAEENSVLKIDLLWCDVQGAEREVILGAQDILKTTMYVYLEYGETDCYEGAMNLDETIKALPGFKVLDVIENNVLMKNRSYC